MRGAIPPLPHVFMSWCLVKHGDNFTLLLNYFLLPLGCHTTLDHVSFTTVTLIIHP